MYLLHISSSLESIAQLICVFLLFLFVLFLSYWAARISGSIQANSINKNSNIKIIETFRLSNNKYIYVVRIGVQFYALAVCKDSVSVIAQLDEGEIKQQETTLEPINFKNILDKMRNENRKK